MEDKKCEVNEIIDQCKEDVINYILNNPLPKNEEMDEAWIKKIINDLTEEAFTKLSFKFNYIIEEKQTNDNDKIRNAFKKCTDSIQNYLVEDCDLKPSMIKDIARNLNVMLQLLQLDIEDCIKTIKKNENKPSTEELLEAMVESQKLISEKIECNIISSIRDILVENK